MQSGKNAIKKPRDEDGKILMVLDLGFALHRQAESRS